jgi:hypothetical protein
MTRHHAVHAGDVLHIVNDINRLNPEDAEKLYGFEFREGLSIFDPMYNKSFGSVEEWAEFNVQQDDLEYEEDINTYDKPDHTGHR